jgi:hypothetical protein
MLPLSHAVFQPSLLHVIRSEDSSRVPTKSLTTKNGILKILEYPFASVFVLFSIFV